MYNNDINYDDRYDTAENRAARDELLRVVRENGGFYSCNCPLPWARLILPHIKRIADIGGKFAQVKEKFGELRIYLLKGHEKCDSIIREAEETISNWIKAEQYARLEEK